MNKPSKGWRNLNSNLESMPDRESTSARIWGVRVGTWRVEDLHRADGPAVEGDDGTKEWWEHGVLLRGQYSGSWIMVETKDGLLQRIKRLEEEVERLKHG